MSLLFSSSTLLLCVFLTLLLLKPHYTADVPYGTRLSSLGKLSFSLTTSSSSLAAASPKAIHSENLQMSSSQLAPQLKQPLVSPISGSHYEVDFPLSDDDSNNNNEDNIADHIDEKNNNDNIDYGSINDGDGDGDISSDLEKKLLSEITEELPIEKEMPVNVGISSQYQQKPKTEKNHFPSNSSFSSSSSTSSQPEMPPSESVDNAHYIHPLSSLEPTTLHHSALIQAEPIRLSLAAEQHPGNRDGRRQPFMVSGGGGGGNSNGQEFLQAMSTFVHHLPPLTAALPMDHFGDHYHSRRHTSRLIPEHSSSAVHLAAVEQPLRKPTHLGGSTGESSVLSSETVDTARAVATAALNLHITRFAPATVPGIPGRAWKDYPLFAEVPKTSFSCEHTSYGYYADVESGCQAWYYCQPDGRQDAFLCPNGTVFNQKVRVCDWWYNVHCPNAVRLYSVNSDLYKPSSHSSSLSSSSSSMAASGSGPRPSRISPSSLLAIPIPIPPVSRPPSFRVEIQNPSTFITSARLVTPPAYRYRPEHEMDNRRNGGSLEAAGA